MPSRSFGWKLLTGDRRMWRCRQVCLAASAWCDPRHRLSHGKNPWSCKGDHVRKGGGRHHGPGGRGHLHRLSEEVGWISGVVHAGSPSGGGDVTVYVLNINQLSLPTLFLHFCVCFCLYGPLTCISFHKFSQQFFTFSLCPSGLISAFLVLSTIHLLMKVFFIPDVILCGWLGLKHQLTN